MDQNEINKDKNVIRKINVTNAEELIQGILKLEALIETMEALVKQKSLSNSNQFTASVPTSAPAVEVSHKTCLADKPISSNKPVIEVCPEMKMRRELYAMLYKAIATENYEEAARLRDLMKFMIK